MYPDIRDVAVDLSAQLAAPHDAVSISSFLQRSGETILIVHVQPKYRYLCARVPHEWKGVKVECDVAELPSMN